LPELRVSRKRRAGALVELRPPAYNSQHRTIGGVAVSIDAADLTLDEVRDRIRVAKLPVPRERLALVHGLLRDALRPIRALDTREVLTLEPAPTFDAAATVDRP
jgi:hypothetical protein